jgi:hypothetical protein
MNKATEVSITNDMVVVIRKEATITVRLDDTMSFLVAVNRASGGDTEIIPARKPREKKVV